MITSWLASKKFHKCLSSGYLSTQYFFQSTCDLHFCPEKSTHEKKYISIKIKIFHDYICNCLVHYFIAYFEREKNIVKIFFVVSCSVSRNGMYNRKIAFMRGASLKIDACTQTKYGLHQLCLWHIKTTVLDT